MIEIRNLSKRYGEKVALHNLNLEVARGELFAFLGPNGAGKTTTIKILAGLVRPTSGSAAIGGHDLGQAPLEAKALLSYVPDEPYVYEKLTGREFLQLIADLFRMDGPHAARAIAQMTEIFELGEFLDDLCESFSHGMKQRVVIASALLHQPKVLVIDEPMVGLDPKNAKTLKDLLRRMVTERGLTVFMSTHTLSVAEEIADRVGIVARGQLVALGTLTELRSLQREQSAPGKQRLEDLFLRLTEGEPPEGWGGPSGEGARQESPGS